MTTIFVILLTTTTSMAILPVASQAQENCEQSSACTAGLGHQTTPKSISGDQLIYQYEMNYFRGVLRDAGQRCSSIGKKMQIVGNPNCGGPHRVGGCPYCPLEQDCVATFECK